MQTTTMHPERIPTLKWIPAPKQTSPVPAALPTPSKSPFPALGPAFVWRMQLSFALTAILIWLLT